MCIKIFFHRKRFSPKSLLIRTARPSAYKFIKSFLDVTYLRYANTRPKRSLPGSNFNSPIETISIYATSTGGFNRFSFRSGKQKHGSNPSENH